MRSIVFLLISSCWAFASPREDLASPSQQVRDEAAEQLRNAFVLPPRKAWDELVASIKVGETKASVLDRLRLLNAKPSAGAGSGQSSTESYRLDDAWIVWVVFVRDVTKRGAQATTVLKVNLQKDLQHVWVKPPDDFAGTWTTYFVNGERSSEIHYAGDRYSGELTAFRSDGSKAFVQHYGPDGAEGEDTGYFSSGQISYRGCYKGGKQVGTWTHYNEDGSVRSREEHLDQAK